MPTNSPSPTLLTTALAEPLDLQPAPADRRDAAGRRNIDT